MIFPCMLKHDYVHVVHVNKMYILFCSNIAHVNTLLVVTDNTDGTVLLLQTSKYIGHTQRIRIMVLSYLKNIGYLMRIDNFRDLARKLSFLPTELDISDIRQAFLLTFLVLLSIFFIINKHFVQKHSVI